MAPIATAEMLRLGGTAVLALAAWAVLLAGMPAGVEWLCGADGLVSSIAPWDPGRLGALALMWAAMMLAMALPCMLVRAGPAPGLPVLAGVTFFAALLHWSLESTALLGTPVLAAGLIAALLVIEWRKWAGGGGPLWPALQMVGLQLLVDPMSPAWMVVVLLWMLADGLLPDRASILSAVEKSRKAAIVRLAAFD